MADNRPFDPASAMRQWIQQWQRIAGGGPAACAPGEADGAGDAGARMRAAMDLPSGADVAAIAAAVARIDLRLARIEQALAAEPADGGKRSSDRRSGKRKR